MLEDYHMANMCLRQAAMDSAYIDSQQQLDGDNDVARSFQSTV